MAQAYVPIQTYTLSSTSASITFTNIPQSYTDLILKISGRTTTPTSVGESIFISFNGSTSDFSTRVFYGTGSTSGTFTSEARFAGTNNSGGSTTSTFSTTDIYISNYTSSNQKTYGLESVVENNATEGYNYFGSSRWANTSAVTSITLTPNSANAFAINTTATLYGLGGVRATGGTITADSTYTYHTFTSTGSFTALENIKGAEVLVIAGGGAGGTTSAGGGGAGGVVYTPGQTLTAGNSYTAVVGAGGASSNASGSNSTFGSLSATGGGGGAGSSQTPGNGGSGGGGNNAGSARGTGTSGQGNNGGFGVTDSVNYSRGGGGGGAGAAGTTATASQSGNGGIGSTTYSSWGYATSTGQLSGGIYYYAGGGGGGTNSTSYPAGIGGIGGGGAGAAGNTVNGTAATANTGGGGGGGSGNSGVGAAGGSGLVIIRYPN
jgi:hypothetical protein